MFKSGIKESNLDKIDITLRKIMKEKVC